MDLRPAEIVAELYAAMGRADWDAYARHLHPDFRVVEADCLPFGGTWRGLSGFKALVERVFELFSIFEPRLVRLASADDAVLAWVEMRLVGRQSGKAVEMPMIEAFLFADGKLREIRPFYFDPERIRAIL
ncbi:MAG: ketosteroid isomerase [Porticoccaceae bacterium]|nr:MAG: ketosteroid isomerase [Porticoccaceae bacterium]